MTLKELSQKLDITIPNLSYYMNGREPNYDTLIKIADFYDVTVDWLIGRTDQRTSTYQSLDEEVFNRISAYNAIGNTNAKKLELSIFKDEYLKVQDKIVDLLCFLYVLLSLFEQLEKLRPELAYSEVNASITNNLIEIMEYQVDLLDSAQRLLIVPTSDTLFEYYFNALTRIELLSTHFKLLISSMIKLALANFDGNNDKLIVLLDFLKHAEDYGNNQIDEIQLSTLINRLKPEQ